MSHGQLHNKSAGGSILSNSEYGYKVFTTHLLAHILLVLL